MRHNLRWTLRHLAHLAVIALAAAALGGCGGTTTPNVTANLLGSLTVTITPAGAAAATWTVNGGPAHTTGETVENLPAGSYTVHFNALAGFTAPPDQSVAVTAGGAATATGTYAPSAPSTGALLVTITPSGAAAATWTVDAGAAHSSGATVTGLSPGAHTVHFNALTGFTAPPDQSVTVTAGATATATGTYTPVSGNRDVSMTTSSTFNPVDLVVHAGETVVWHNNDGVPHTVTPDSTVPGMGGPNSDPTFPGGLAPGTGQYSFLVPADTPSGRIWYYHCRFHGSPGSGTSLGTGMSGSITVQ